MFDRVVDQRWLNPTSGTATDRFQYAYDLVSNRTSRDNLVNTAFGELYGYDDLSQLVSFQRGTLNATKTGLTGSASRSQSWDTDAVGNFDSVTTDGTAQSRTANRQNEITSISGATTPTYDDNGNMTGDETGRQFVYDAWNRLVIVKNSGGTTLETFKYDGLNRRVSSSDGTTRDLYYSDQWQTLEEKVSGNTTKRYVWSPVYVDAMILRDRDTDSNGTLDERLWVQQDANWNVTALVNGSGTVVERYAYDPYGARTVYDASYTVRSGGSSYDFQHGFQGMWFDVVAGLNEADRRWYSPSLQLWISIDPIRFAGGDLNLYGFVGANPVGSTDPSGLGRLETSPGGSVYYQGTGPLGTVGHTRLYVGKKTTQNGKVVVVRVINHQPYYVQYSKLEDEEGRFTNGPDNWDDWFKQNRLGDPNSAGALATNGIPELGIPSTFQMYPGVDRLQAVKECGRQASSAYSDHYIYGPLIAVAMGADIAVKVKQFSNKSLGDQRDLYRSLLKTYRNHLKKYGQAAGQTVGETNRMERELAEFKRILESRGRTFGPTGDLLD